jgi:hypothetical protein
MLVLNQWLIIIGSLCLGVLIQWYIIRSAVKKAIKEAYNEIKRENMGLPEDKKNVLTL